MSPEDCVAFPTIAATTAGYTVLEAGVVLTYYPTAALEMLERNASPRAPDLYVAIVMPFAVLVGQLAAAHAWR